MPPDPILPAFDGPCLTNLAGALFGVLAAHHGAAPDVGGPPEAPWLPAALRSCRQIVLLVIDGLGWEQLQERTSIAPTLASGEGGPITTVAPSSTPVALTSLTTGLAPAAHGLVGFRMLVDEQLFHPLAWRLGGRDARQLLPPPTFQPTPAFAMRPAELASVPVPVVSREEFAASGFSAAFLAGTKAVPWVTVSGLVVEVRRLLEERAPFVLAYSDGIDRVSHTRGLGAHYDEELRATDRLVADLLAVLPPGAGLVVTSDHGQVEVGQRLAIFGPEIMEQVEAISGEGRFRWLHVRSGALDDVAAAAHAAFDDVAWVRTRAEVLAEGWLGGAAPPEVLERLGDVVLAPFAPLAFLDPADTGEQRLVARHGSLTAAEMLVPLLAWVRG